MPDDLYVYCTQSLEWRAKYGADSLLATYEPPAVLTRYYIGGVCGTDKQGSPIWLEPYAGLDVKGQPIISLLPLATATCHLLRPLLSLCPSILYPLSLQTLPSVPSSPSLSHPIRSILSHHPFHLPSLIPTFCQLSLVPPAFVPHRSQCHLSRCPVVHYLCRYAASHDVTVHEMLSSVVCNYSISLSVMEDAVANMIVSEYRCSMVSTILMNRWACHL